MITLFVFSDLLDGLIARARAPAANGAPSSIPRVTASPTQRSSAASPSGTRATASRCRLAAAAIYALAAGGIISYVKARAESLGFDCNAGFAERGERLLIVLVAAAIGGLGVPWLLPAALWFLCAATTYTIGQRLVYVYKQARDLEPKPERPTRRPRRRVIVAVPSPRGEAQRRSLRPGASRLA